MIRIFLTILVLLMGTVQGLEAQNRQGGGRPEVGPVNLLLDLRDELALTPRQIRTLERIDEEMDRLNQPLMDQVRELRVRIRALGPRESMTAEQRALFESHVAQARPVMQKIQENNWAAMRQVGEVLTEQQKELMAKRLRELGETNRERSGNFPRRPDPGI